jgi:hypothetical protein
MPEPGPGRSPVTAAPWSFTRCCRRWARPTSWTLQCPKALRSWSWVAAPAGYNEAPGQRRAFLATCRYHVRDEGVAVFQYHPPGWFDAFPAAPREGAIGEIAASLARSGLW